MRTEVAAPQSVSVFLFAHQDDECGVFEQIYLACQQGCRAICIYATTGVPAGHDPSQRNQESVAVLRSIGVAAQDIIFAGAQLAVADGSLVNHLCDLSEWFEQWLAQQSHVAHIYVPAWEGGHPDHDGLHAMAVQVGSETGLLPRVHQYPLYNGYHCFRPWFRVFLPLSCNGTAQYRAIPWQRRLKFLKCALGYPSQWRTWVGFFPFFLLHQIFWGTEVLQAVSVMRLRERPHGGDLYYEMRRFLAWEEMQRAIRQWVATRPGEREE